MRQVMRCICRILPMNKEGCDKVGYIPLTEYAKKHHRARTTVYLKYQNGGFKTAYKIGRSILIDENEPYVTQRKPRVKVVADADEHVSATCDIGGDA